MDILTKLIGNAGNNNNHEELEKICVNFHSTNQIKTWLSKTLDDIYNDISLLSHLEGSSRAPSSPRKYESMKKRLSINVNVTDNDNSTV